MELGAKHRSACRFRSSLIQVIPDRRCNVWDLLLRAQASGLAPEYQSKASGGVSWRDQGFGPQMRCNRRFMPHEKDRQHLLYLPCVLSHFLQSLNVQDFERSGAFKAESCRLITDGVLHIQRRCLCIERMGLSLYA